MYIYLVIEMGWFAHNAEFVADNLGVNVQDRGKRVPKWNISEDIPSIVKCQLAADSHYDIDSWAPVGWVTFFSFIKKWSICFCRHEKNIPSGEELLNHFWDIAGAN